GGESDDAFASVATSLLRAGVRSVVAMSYSLYVSAARELLPAFYRRLFESGSGARGTPGGRQAPLAPPGGEARLGPPGLAGPGALPATAAGAHVCQRGIGRSRDLRGWHSGRRPAGHAGDAVRADRARQRRAGARAGQPSPAGGAAGPRT